MILRASAALIASILPAVAVNAADCVQLDGSGRLIPTGDPVEACAEHLLITGSEYNQLFAVSSLFNVTTTEIQQAFTAGFVLPLLIYLTAWAYQSVINFSTKSEN